MRVEIDDDTRWKQLSAQTTEGVKNNNTIIRHVK